MADNSLLVPAEEAGRQAVASLRGYVYQIYQSLAAWRELGEGETLVAAGLLAVIRMPIERPEISTWS